MSDPGAAAECEAAAVHRFAIPGLPQPPARLVSPELVTTFEGARELFLAGAHHIKAASSFFVLDGFVTEAVELAQDNSRLYKYLAAFEPDTKRRLAMHARRVALLSPLVDALNPHIFISQQKELRYELGEVHSDMLDIRMSVTAAAAGGAAAGTEVRKRDELALKAIEYFGKFIDMFQSPEGAPADVVDDDNTLSFLTAHFCIARLEGMRNQYPPAGAALATEALRRSLQRYEWIVAYCKRHGVGKGHGSVLPSADGGPPPDLPAVASVFVHELAIATEMAELLPAKIRLLMRTAV